jgi:hypothetical protein
MDRAAPDLDSWLEPFLAALGHKKRRTWAPLYLRGLLGPGERKSLQPMAACLGLSGHDQLQHFIASPAWDDGPLWRVLAGQADRLVGGPGAVLVIDDTALPKKGTLSACRTGLRTPPCFTPSIPEAGSACRCRSCVAAPGRRAALALSCLECQTMWES